MFNAISRYFYAAAVLLAVTACGNAERDSAKTLLDESRQAVEKHDYNKAFELLDTLNVRYRAQTEVRREALVLRAQAMEGMAIDSISAGDRALAEATLALDAFDGKFRHVDSSVGLDGYYLPEGVSDKVMTTTGIQPRISDDGHFYIVANVQGRTIGLESIEFSANGTTVASTVLSPSRVISVEGSEIASFTPEDLEGIAPWIIANPDIARCVLHGSKGNIEVKLTPAAKKQLVECASYAGALQAKRLAMVHREKYERMLAAARDQLANMPVKNDAE